MFELIGACCVCLVRWKLLVFFFNQKTAYAMRISDWSSDVCSSDLRPVHRHARRLRGGRVHPSPPFRQLRQARRGAEAGTVCPQQGYLRSQVGTVDSPCLPRSAVSTDTGGHVAAIRLAGLLTPLDAHRSLVWELTKREVLGRYRGSSFGVLLSLQIGRASCRERVCQAV